MNYGRLLETRGIAIVQENETRCSCVAHVRTQETGFYGTVSARHLKAIQAWGVPPPIEALTWAACSNPAAVSSSGSCYPGWCRSEESWCPGAKSHPPAA